MNMKKITPEEIKKLSKRINKLIKDLRWFNALENKDLTTLQKEKETLELKVKNLRQTGFSSQSHETVPFITALNVKILKLTEEITDLQEERKTLVLKNKALVAEGEIISEKIAAAIKNGDGLTAATLKYPWGVNDIEQEATNKRILELDAKILKITTKETIEPKEETINQPTTLKPEPKKETKETTTTIIQNEGLPPVAIFGIVSGTLGAFVMIVLITIHFKNKFKKQKASEINFVE